MDVDEDSIRQIRAARFLSKVNPRRYLLEWNSEMEGMYILERLIDKKTSEVLVKWTLVQKLGLDVIDVDEDYDDVVK